MDLSLRHETKSDQNHQKYLFVLIALLVSNSVAEKWRNTDLSWQKSNTFNGLTNPENEKERRFLNMSERNQAHTSCIFELRCGRNQVDRSLIFSNGILWYWHQKSGGEYH